MRAKSWGGMEGNNVQLAARLLERGVQVKYTALGTGVYSLMPAHYAELLEVEEIDWPWEDPVPFAAWYRMMRERPADIAVLPKDWWSKGGIPMLAAAALVYDRVLTREHVVAPSVAVAIRNERMLRPLWYYRHVAYGRLLSLLSDRSICVSETVRTRLVEQYGFSRRRTVTVHNGVDCNVFRFDAVSRMEFRRHHGIPDDALVYGSVARLDCGTKRHDLSLSAFARLVAEHPGKKLHFLLVGDGPDRENLLELSQQLGVGRQFTIAPFTSSPWRAYSALDVFLMPSAFEAFGLALVEAMACERCVIGTRTGGIAEILTEPEVGWCIPQGDDEALYESMRTSLLHSEPGRAKMGVAARASVLERFDASQQYARIIEHVLGAV